MKRLLFRALFVSLTLPTLCCWPQTQSGAQPPLTKEAQPAPALHLTPTGNVLSQEVSATFSGPFVCDHDGSLYLRSESASVAAVRKLNSKGERVALFSAKTTSDSDVKVDFVGSFAANPDNEVYMLVDAKELSRYVFILRSDGSYKGKIKLQPGFPWLPSSLAVFSNGTLLVTGQANDTDRNKPMLPFTGIFAADGRLVKEVQLEDDDTIHEMAQANDPKVIAVTAPDSNRAISWGQVKGANDGNVYIMRWLSPAVFYAVSPSGHVVRRFTVDSGNTDYKPIGMHIDGNRIAVLFFHPQTMEKVMKVVSLEGEEIASYDELLEGGKPKAGMLGLAFACYTQRPERFTFLVTDDSHRIQLRSAEAR